MSAKGTQHKQSHGKGRAPRRPSRVFHILTVVVLVVGAWLWASDLTSDPPMYYSALGQSVLTDPANVVFHARNAVLFGAADPFDYGRWVVFRESIMSAAAYVWFSAVGVSYQHAGAIAMILNLGGLLLVLLGLMKHHRPWVLTVVALAWMMNATLLVYGRLTYLENGLVFLTGALFYVYSWWGHRAPGAVVAGVLAAMATLTGKLFGALLLPALVVSILADGALRSRTRVIGAVLGYIATAALLVLVLYGGDTMAALGYVREQAYGLRGFPEGLSSPWGFFEHLIQFGYQNRFYYLTPDLFLFLMAGGLGLVAFVPRPSEHLPRTLVLSFAWIGVVWLGLMPLNYSPVRYVLVLIPALIVGCYGLLELLLRTKRVELQRFGTLRVMAAGILLWHLLYHVVGNVVFFIDTPARVLTWATLPAAGLLVYLLAQFSRRGNVAIGRRYVMGALVMVVALSVTSNAFRIRRTQVLDDTGTVVAASEDLENILGAEAVVSGPYGPALTLDTDLRAFIHMFGVAAVDSTLFDRMPVTHVAVDVTNFEQAVEAYPELEGQPAIASYWLNSWHVKLYRINDLFDNPAAHTYEMTDYERSMQLFLADSLREAQAVLNRFLSDHEMTRAPGLLQTDLYLRTQKLEFALQTMVTLAREYPDDFSIQMRCGQLYYIAALASRNRSYLRTADMYFQKGLEVNRFQGPHMKMLKQQAQQLVNRQSTPGS